MTDDRLSKQEVHPGIGITDNVDQLIHDPSAATAKGHLLDVDRDLSGNHEHDEGEAKLFTLSGDLMCDVRYSLDVWPRTIGSSATLDPLKIERKSCIVITPQGGQHLPDGSYQLETAHEILTVAKYGNDWKLADSAT